MMHLKNSIGLSKNNKTKKQKKDPKRGKNIMIKKWKLKKCIKIKEIIQNSQGKKYHWYTLHCDNV